MVVMNEGTALRRFAHPIGRATRRNVVEVAIRVEGHLDSFYYRNTGTIGQNDPIPHLPVAFLNLLSLRVADLDFVVFCAFIHHFHK